MGGETSLAGLTDTCELVEFLSVADKPAAGALAEILPAAGVVCQWVSSFTILDGLLGVDTTLWDSAGGVSAGDLSVAGALFKGFPAGGLSFADLALV